MNWRLLGSSLGFSLSLPHDNFVANANHYDNIFIQFQLIDNENNIINNNDSDNYTMGSQSNYYYCIIIRLF